MNFTQIKQFSFSAFNGMGTSPGNAIAGWSTIDAGPDYLLVSVPAQTQNLQVQQFNCYVFNLPSNMSGEGMILQSPTNGKYLVAKNQDINGVPYTVFSATGSDRETAAQFAYYSYGSNQSFLWMDPNSKKWYGLYNLETGPEGGGIVVTYSNQPYNMPYLLSWGAGRSALSWQYIAPAGWWRLNNVFTDMSWADFTLFKSANLPFDFDNCILNNTDFSGRTFNSATFRGCDLSNTLFSPTIATGLVSNSPVDLTGATINYSSLGPDWRYVILSHAIINNFPALPEKPPQIDARNAILHYLNMEKWNLPGADFTGAEMWNVNLSFANLMGSKFHGALLSAPAHTPGDPSPANLSYSYLFDTDLSDAQAVGVNFSYAFLFGSAATVSGAWLTMANFANACLPELDFSGVYQKDLSGVNFVGACLVSANFQGTQLGMVENIGFSFNGTALQAADFTGSDLRGAFLTDAAIAIDDPPQGGIQFPITSIFQIGSLNIPINAITYTRKTYLAPTDERTYCPSDTGPCAGNKLIPANPAKSPLKSWPASVTQTETFYTNHKTK